MENGETSNGPTEKDCPFSKHANESPGRPQSCTTVSAVISFAYTGMSGLRETSDLSPQTWSEWEWVSSTASNDDGRYSIESAIRFFSVRGPIPQSMRIAAPSCSTTQALPFDPLDRETILT